MEVLNRKKAQAFVRRMEAIWNHVRGAINTAQDRQRKQANKKRRTLDYAMGDFVYVTIKNWSTDRLSKKLSNLMAGPYKIIK